VKASTSWLSTASHRACEKSTKIRLLHSYLSKFSVRGISKHVVDILKALDVSTSTNCNLMEQEKRRAN
jgi:hypothetical protein